MTASSPWGQTGEDVGWQANRHLPQQRMPLSALTHAALVRAVLCLLLMLSACLVSNRLCTNNPALRPDIDYEAAWRRELGSSSTTASGATGGGSNGCKAGWVGHIPVLAYVVTIKNAAAPDREGLINPLLKRWQARQPCCDLVAWCMLSTVG